MTDLRVIVKGAGEMATGIAHRLFMAGITRIIMTDIAHPLAVRRGVAFCEAVHEGFMEVEDVRAELIQDGRSVDALWGRHCVGVIIDPAWKIIAELKPDVVVDAIMAKRRNTAIRTYGGRLSGALFFCMLKRPCKVQEPRTNFFRPPSPGGRDRGRGPIIFNALVFLLES